MPVIRFRYARPDQRGFSFCKATIKSRKQFAARNSLKGDGREPPVQFRLMTKLTNVVGISFIFVTNFGRYPRPGGNTFSSTTFPSTDYGTLFLYQNSFLVRIWFICSLRVSAVSLTVRSPWSVNSSVRRPFFAFSRPGHRCLSYGFRHTLPRIRIAPVNQTVLAHIVLF